jgi:hypothetical protein
MAVTSDQYGVTATNVAGTWTNLTNAQGSTSGTNASFSSTAAGATATLQLAGYVTSEVPSGSTVTNVIVTVRWTLVSPSGFAGIVSGFSGQLLSGTTVKSTQTLATAVGTDQSTTWTVTGITYADLADLRVRVVATNAGAAGVTRTYSVDWAKVVVTYTAPAPTYAGAFFQFF